MDEQPSVPMYDLKKVTMQIRQADIYAAISILAEFEAQVRNATIKECAIRFGPLSRKRRASNRRNEG